MTQPVVLPHFSLGENLGVAQFLFGVERINKVPRSLNEWLIILSFSKNYCRSGFPSPGMHFPGDQEFWARFLKLRNENSSHGTLLDPGSPPDANEVEFITRLSSSYALLLWTQSAETGDVDETPAPLITPEAEASLLRNAFKTGELFNALDLHKIGNSIVFLCGKWQIVRHPV